MNVLAGQPWIRCSKCTLYLVGYWSEVIITFPPADVAVPDSPGATAIRVVVASFDSTAGALVVSITVKGASPNSLPLFAQISISSFQQRYNIYRHTCHCSSSVKQLNSINSMHSVNSVNSMRAVHSRCYLHLWGYFYLSSQKMSRHHI